MTPASSRRWCYPVLSAAQHCFTNIEHQQEGRLDLCKKAERHLAGISLILAATIIKSTSPLPNYAGRNHVLCTRPPLIQKPSTDAKMLLYHNQTFLLAPHHTLIIVLQHLNGVNFFSFKWRLRFWKFCTKILWRMFASKFLESVARSPDPAFIASCIFWPFDS